MTRYFTVFTNRRMLVSLLLGFSSGIPLALVTNTLQAWLSFEKIDVKTVGEFALVGLPYALKFLWAPLFDSRPLPFMGLRRGWMVVCQVGLFAATVGLALSDPTQRLSTFALMAFLVSFFSASQDIVVDAYRTEIIDDPAELGAGASTYIAGYRIAMVIAGGVAISLSAATSWQNVYVLMALLNLVGMVTIFFSPEPKIVRSTNRMTAKDAVLMPLLDFFKRVGAMEILIFIMVYKLSTLMATALTTKFLVELGYDALMIGTVNKMFGLIFTILGTLVGGSLMVKLGLKRSLWIFGIIQAMVGLTFMFLNEVAHHEAGLRNLYLIIIVSLDNFMMGLGTAALTGFMMKFASKKFTATQYALLTSVMAVSRVVLIAHAGTLVEWLGWNMFFLSTVPLAIPGLLLLSRYEHWHVTADDLSARKIPTLDLAVIGLFVMSLICLSSDPIFQWLEMKETGAMLVKVGAFGVLFVVAFGILKPYIFGSSVNISGDGSRKAI